MFQTLTGDLEGEGIYTPAVSFDFEALTCTGSCEIATSVEPVDSEGSDGSTGRTMAIVVGSVVSGVGVAAIVIIGALLLKRRKRGAKTNGAGPAKNADPADPSAPAPIPVFEVRRLFFTSHHSAVCIIVPSFLASFYTFRYIYEFE